MVIVKLRAAMEAFRHRTNRRITYAELSERTGVSVQTLSSIASRPTYKPSLDTVEKLCLALDVPLHDMLELIPDPPKAKQRAKKKRRG